MSEQKIDRYPLPNDWVWSTLGEICSKPQYGYTTKAVNEGTLRLLRTTDITSGQINWDMVPFCLHDPDEPEKYLLRDGDIVISRAGSVGYSMLVERPEKAVFASYLIRFRTFVNRYFLKYFLQSPFYWREISDTKSGIALANVNAKKLQAIPIPIPPPNEQRRIVAKIEELFSQLDAGVAALEQARAQLKRYRQALLKAAFEGRLTEQWRQTHPDELEPADVLLARIRAERDARWRAQLAAWEEAVQAWEAAGRPGKKPRKPRKPKDLPPLTEEELPELPEGWGWGKLGLMTLGVEYGTSAKSQKSGRVPVLRMGNIQNFKFEWDDLVFTDDEEEIAKYLLKRGDVLFNRTNSPELVGKTAIFDSDREAIFAGYLIRVNHLLEIVDSRYLNYFLNSFVAREHGNKVKTDGVNQSNINGSKLINYPFPYCSLSEQERIAEMLDLYFSVIDYLDQTIEEALARAASLRQAILKKAFTGRLVPQDPEDEPASVLLERVRAEKEHYEALRHVVGPLQQLTFPNMKEP